MDRDSFVRSFVVFLVSVAVLAFAVSFRSNALLLYAFVSFVIILGVSFFVKNLVGYWFEIDVEHKFWSFQRFWFGAGDKFKQPVPMVWFPLFVSLMSKGLFWWLGVLVFDVKSRPERASRRHGLYRFTQVTEWHIGLIAFWGVVGVLLLSFVGYLSGFELFSKFCLYYAFWSMLPLSRFDGAKIFFSNRRLWFVSFLVVLVLAFLAFVTPSSI